MNEYIPRILAALAALFAVGWYCRRWGISDGYAEGYDAGRTNGLLEGAGVAVSPNLAGGPGAVPR